MDGFEAYLDKWDFDDRAWLFSWASFILIILHMEKEDALDRRNFAQTSWPN